MEEKEQTLVVRLRLAEEGTLVAPNTVLVFQPLTQCLETLRARRTLADLIWTVLVAPDHQFLSSFVPVQKQFSSSFFL